MTESPRAKEFEGMDDVAETSAMRKIYWPLPLPDRTVSARAREALRAAE